MKFSLEFTLILLLLLPGCGCKDNEIITVLLSEEFKRYIDFSAGSWWVYEKIDEPGVTDSIYIYSYKNTIEEDKKECFKFEKIRTLGVQVNTSYTDSISMLSSFLFNYKADQRSYLIYSNPKGRSYDLFFSPNELGEISNYSFDLKVLTKSPQEIINGETYINTVTFTSSNKRRIISETYAQDVGVVRRIHQDSSIFELKSYFINK